MGLYTSDQISTVVPSMASKTWRDLEIYWGLTQSRVKMTADFQMITILPLILSQKGCLSAQELKLKLNLMDLANLFQ